MLIAKLEPLKLASFLSSSAYFSQSEIDRINASPSRSERVLNLLSFIESGDSEVVKDFVSALTDAGFSDLAKLLDPIYFHHKAGKYILKISLFNCNFHVYFSHKHIYIYMYQLYSVM